MANMSRRRRARPITPISAAKPLPPKRRCTLGRETSLQKCVWRDDDWLYPENGTAVPDVDVPGLFGAVPVEKPMRSEYNFDGGTLPADFQWLRTPEPERIFNLTDRAYAICA